MSSLEPDAPEIVRIVDYDIPQKPPGRRRQFYRKRAKIYTKQRKHIISSTASVLICRTEELAKAIYTLASEYGKAHLYRVIEEGSSAA